MNYYNDNDPRACAWLRELIAAGVTSSRVQPACSASGQAERDTSGKESKPYRATDSWQRFSMHRSVRNPACGQYPRRASLRKIRTLSEHSDGGGESGQGCDLATVSPLFFLGTATHVLDSACATLERSEPRERGGIRQSTSTSDSVPDVRETSCRTHGMIEDRQSPCASASIETPRRNPASRTGYRSAGIHTRSHSGRISVSSCRHNGISSRGAQ